MKLEEKHKQQEIQRLKKVEIEKWKNSKKLKEEQEKFEKNLAEEREKEQKVILANRMIREFQTLDYFYIRKKRAHHLAAKLKEFESKTNGPVGKQYPRDPKRVFQPTKQWLARTEASNEEKPTDFKFEVKYINQVPKL